MVEKRETMSLEEAKWRLRAIAAVAHTFASGDWSDERRRSTELAMAKEWLANPRLLAQGLVKRNLSDAAHQGVLQEARRVLRRIIELAEAVQAAGEEPEQPSP